MATFVGYPASEYQIAPAVPQESAGQEGIHYQAPTRMLLGTPPIDGEKELHQPINILDRSTHGWLEFSYFNDYYERVWFIPSVVDFGPITARTSFPVFLWNAHLRPTTLDSVTSGGDSSLTIEGLAVPLTLNALGGTFFNVVADINGDPVIDSNFAFSFDPLEVVNLPIAGIRARLWPFRCNWKDGFETSYELRTEIIQSENGREQRIATRQTPRKGFRFNSIVHEANFREFIRQMNFWQGRSTIVAEYTKFGRLAADAVAGEAYLVMESTPDWMMPGGLLVLLDKQGNSLLRTIDEIDGNTVALTGIVDGEWSAGMKVYKGVPGRIATQIQATQHTNRTATVAVIFDADPGRETYPDAGVGSIQHRGREVLLKRPNWDTSPTPSFEVNREVIDYGTGTIDFVLPFDFNDRFHKAEYVGRDIADVDAIERFYHRVMGQQVEFFMPTFTEDLVIMATVPATTSSLRISGPETARDFALDIVYKDLIIWFHDGSYLMRTVQDIYEVTDIVGNDTIIQVTEPFAFAMTPDSIRQICWMPLWRLASDTLTLSHLTDEVAEFALTMKTLPYEDAE